MIAIAIVLRIECVWVIMCEIVSGFVKFSSMYANCMSRQVSLMTRILFFDQSDLRKASGVHWGLVLVVGQVVALGVTVIRPMELDLKCLKMTDWNKTNGIGPIDPSRRHLDG